jgi:hypothetical protein
MLLPGLRADADRFLVTRLRGLLILLWEAGAIVMVVLMKKENTCEFGMWKESYELDCVSIVSSLSSGSNGMKGNDRPKCEETAKELASHDFFQIFQIQTKFWKGETAKINRNKEKPSSFLSKEQKPRRIQDCHWATFLEGTIDKA